MVVAGRRAPRRTPAPPISPLGRLAGVPALLVVGRASVGVVGVVLLLVVVAPAVAGRLVPYLTVVVPVVGSSPPGPSRGSIILSLTSSPDPTPPLLPSGLGGSKGVRSGGGSCSALLRGGRLPELGRGGNPSPPTAPPSPSSLHLPRCPASRQPPRRRRSSASTLWRSMCQRVPPS